LTRPPTTPLDPVACARLISDLVVLIVGISGSPAASLCAASIDAEGPHQGSGELASGGAVRELHATTVAPCLGT
jgi:hypothetical protein